MCVWNSQSTFNVKCASVAPVVYSVMSNDNPPFARTDGPHHCDLSVNGFRHSQGGILMFGCLMTLGFREGLLLTAFVVVNSQS